MELLIDTEDKFMGHPIILKVRTLRDPEKVEKEVLKRWRAWIKEFTKHSNVIVPEGTVLAPYDFGKSV